MPKDFIKAKFNSRGLSIAQRQQKQLSYFTESKVQEDVVIDYLKNWTDRNHRTDDHFLNFVKTVFKKENFALMAKFLRFPLPSSRLVNDKIKTPLKRVFFSEDSYFKYKINGNIIKNPAELDTVEFNNMMFNALLFKHNDILVEDLSAINTPFKTLVSIDNVVSIDSKDSVIRRIAFTAQAIVGGVVETGVLYIDDQRYILYDSDIETILIEAPHDLGRCPADYISSESFSDNDVVRKSIFTYSREELEEYVFLKTLQRMVEPNGAIPIVTMIEAGIKNENSDGKGENKLEPMSADVIGGQRAEEKSTIDSGSSLLESGNKIGIPIQAIRKDDGSLDMEVVKNFFTFHHTPVEALTYLDDRIKDIEGRIVSDVIGDHSEGKNPEGSKSDKEIDNVVIVSRQDRLRDLSKQLGRIRTRSDFNFLTLKHGPGTIENTAFYGSDFFLETQKDIYDMIKIAPNPIEQSSLLIKSARNRNRFNEDNFNRDVLLYKLLPYSVKEDFDAATSNNSVDPVTFQYQTRFNYWIEIFEANFGDIVMFFDSLEGSDSEKLIIIDNLIKGIISEAIVPQQTNT